MLAVNQTEYLAYLIYAEYDWQLLFSGWAYQVKRYPVPLECTLVEELDSTQCDRAGTARNPLDILEIQKILP
jgi:hypothetical protein